MHQVATSPRRRDSEWLLHDRATLVGEADDLLHTLYPICRSITGDGVRQTLTTLQHIVEFDTHEIASETPCYDWVVPDEWNVYDAYIADENGVRIIDFKRNNLHLVSYSIPVNQTMTFAELEPHLHTLPNLPNAIPYRTSYYHRDWGFCVTHEQFQSFDRLANYHVVVDSRLEPGSLTYGERRITGHGGGEYLISTYCCHPSMANDNLSGLVLWALLLRELQSVELRHNYQFVVAPETIGSITYLAMNEERMKKIDGGFVVTTVAGPGKVGYKETFRGDAEIDRVVRRTFAEKRVEHISYPFALASDERNYSSPFFRIPMGTICKGKYYEYPYYHTSLDDLSFTSADALVETLEFYLLAINKLEMNCTYHSLVPQCEPALGKRGLYPLTGGSILPAAAAETDHEVRRYRLSDGHEMSAGVLDALKWVAFLSGGDHSILDISEKTDLPMHQVYEAAEILRKHSIVKLVEPEG